MAQGKQALSDRATCEVAPGEASAALGAATLQSSDIATGRSQTDATLDHSHKERESERERERESTYPHLG